MTERTPNSRSTYVTELRAGSFVKRICTSMKPKGGSSIIWLYDNDCYGNEYATGEFLVPSTGEIKRRQDNSYDGRLANPAQIRKACEKFKWKIRANQEDARLFVTLTYAENMTDTRQLYEDFRRFWQRFKNKFNVKGYLMACEPQERGAWHIHMITIGGDEFIKNDKIAKFWGHGFTKTQKCSEIADLGNYLTSYLTLTDSKKCSRLHMYPARFRFLRWSKGLKEPEIRKYEQFQEVPPDGYHLMSEHHVEKEIDGLDKPMYIDVYEYCEEKTYVLYITARNARRMGKGSSPPPSDRRLRQKGNCEVPKESVNRGVFRDWRCGASVHAARI